jgi:hypothetical protein
MTFHLEISEIRLARKTNDRVQHLSPGPHAMAGFDLTTEEEFLGAFKVWATIESVM